MRSAPSVLKFASLCVASLALVSPALASARAAPTSDAGSGPFAGVLASPLATPAAAGSSVVSAWGENTAGELGDGNETNTDVPVEVLGPGGVTAIAAGGYHNLELLEGGTVMAWGTDGDGRLGTGTLNGPETCSNQYSCSRVPIEVKGLSGVTAISAGRYHSLALLSNGTVMAWGDNREGQLGNGTTENTGVPTLVPGLSGVTAIAAGGEYSLALLSDGKVMAWGANGSGQLGDGTNTTRLKPVEVSGLNGVTAIAAGWHHSLAVLSNGTVMSWGFNREGELGQGFTSEDSSTPSPVCAVGESYPCANDLTGVVAVSAGTWFSMALLSNGTVATWGWNGWGELGNGTTSEGNVPALVSGSSEVIAISAGGNYALDLSRGGSVRAWGEGLNGQLGDNASKTSDSPVLVSGLTEATEIGAGENHSIALAAPPTPYPRVVSVTPNEGVPVVGRRSRSPAPTSPVRPRRRSAARARKASSRLRRRNQGRVAGGHGHRGRQGHHTAG